MIIENKIAFYVVLPYHHTAGIPNTALIMITESQMKTIKTIVESIKTNKFNKVSVGIDPDIYLISSDGSVYSNESTGITSLIIAGDYSANMVVYSKNICGSKIEIKL